jgi:hypothetical protein
MGRVQVAQGRLNLEFSTAMLVLYETALGFCLFKVTDSGKLETPSTLWEEFQTPEKANGLYAFPRIGANSDVET